MLRQGTLTTRITTTSLWAALVSFAAALLAVSAAQALQVSISADRESVPMGGSVAVDVRVTNDSGQPVEGAASYLI